MKIWRFEFKRRENTIWDFILPIGFSLLPYPFIRGFYKEVIKSFGFSLSGMLSFLLLAGIIIIIMYNLTLYLSRVQRVFVFPLLYLFSLLLMWAYTKLYLVFLVLAINGTGFTAGNIALAMLFGESQNIPKGKLLAPILLGAILGITGAVISFILALLFGVIPFILFFLPPLWTLRFFFVYSHEPWFQNILEINSILWFFIFFVLGVAAVRIWRKLKETSNGKLSIKEEEDAS